MNVSQRRALQVAQLTRLAQHLLDEAERLEQAKSHEEAKGVHEKLVAVEQDIRRCRRGVSDLLVYVYDAEHRGRSPLV